MKSPVLETRRAAVIAAANAVSGGLPCAAAFLGEEDFKRFKNRIYESAGVKRLTDDEVCVLETQAKTTFLPDYICGMYGGVFVRLPETEQVDNVDLYQRSLHESVLRGDMDRFVEQALADGEMDEGEAKRYRSLHAKYITASLEKVGAVIALHKARAQ